jgi:hypothetical protein
VQRVSRNTKRATRNLNVMNIVEIYQFGEVESDRFRLVTVHTLGHSKNHTVLKKMNIGQDKLFKLVTMGNIGFANMLKSAFKCDGN